MTDELNGGADAPADDLRSTLSTAWDAAEAPAATAEPSASPAPETPAETRARDEAGRFAKSPAVTDSPAAAAAFEQPKADQQQAAPQEGQQQAPAAPAGPPPGWSVAAKAAFETLPPAVKEAVARREEEVNRGFAKLADYKGLDPVVEAARNAGLEPAQVMQSYMAAEQLLEQDFLGGIANICSMFNVDPRELASAIMGGQAPEGQQPQDPVFHKLNSLEQTVQQLMQQRQHEAERHQTEIAQNEVQQFAANPANRYFENVRHDMAILYQTGRANTLQDAYDMACRLNPEIYDLQIKEQIGKQQAAAKQQIDQKIRAAGSLPPGTPHSDAGIPPKNQSLRSALLQSWDSAGASI